MSGPILVTGAKGFVGTHLLARLGAEGRPLEVDVTDANAAARHLFAAAPRAVVHLAAMSSVADSWSGTQDVWRVNVLGTVNVLEAVRASRPEARVLVVSTGQVYGRTDQIPTPEDAPLAPISPYAASKAAAEIACEQARAAGLDVVVARSFQHEGPGRDERFAVGSWAAQIARAEVAGGGTLLVGDLSAKRDISDVRDVCDAYQLLLDPDVPAGTYNVSSGKAVMMQEVLDSLVRLAQCPITVEHEPERSRSTDLPVVCGDSSKLRAAASWTPTIALAETLADTLDAQREAVTERTNA